jgi:hypothetical protein
MWMAINRFTNHNRVRLARHVARAIAATPRRAVAAVRTVGGREDLDSSYARQLQRTREKAALLPIPKGSTDLYPHRSALLAGMPVEYRPRPAFQSYLAYTPRLAELNATHLRGGSAPDSILVAIEPIDRRWPSLEDGPSWPELMARYRPTAVKGKHVLLERLPRPRTLRMEPLAVIEVGAGDAVPIPDDISEVRSLYAEIDVESTALRAAANVLFKAPALYITARLRDGRVIKRRLVAGMAKAGFILSLTPRA